MNNLQNNSQDSATPASGWREPNAQICHCQDRQRPGQRFTVNFLAPVAEKPYAVTMATRFLFLIYLMFALTAWLSPLWANTEEENGDLLSSTLSALSREDWVTAEHFAAQISDPVGLDIANWVRLRQGEGTWDEYVRFLDQHPGWPGRKQLQKRGEAVMPKGWDAAKTRTFFASQPPQTGTGALRLVEALQAQGRISDARTQAIRAWVDLSLAPLEQSLLLSQFQGMLSQRHIKRLDNLLWNGRTREAERMLPLVAADQVKLARARIALARAAPGVDPLINAVPASLRDHPGLVFDRFMWRVKKGRWDAAQALLEERTRSDAGLGHPEKWAKRREGFARRAMRAGDFDLAYLLASQHGLNQGGNFAALEWLAGFVALRKQHDAPKALAHFESFLAVVASPISLGRAGYWLGKTHEVMGDSKAAKSANALAAKYQTCYYGQLAAEEINAPPDASLSGTQSAPDWRTAGFANTGPVRAGLMLHYAQEPRLMGWFFTHVAETLNPTELAQLAELALELDQPNVALRVAKEGAKRGFVLPRAYYPVTELSAYSVDVPPEVAMSIARRESELDAQAVSPAGARGLMQIMPGTARKVADDLGLDYSIHRLTTDWRYNATLGTAYLGGLLEIYQGSYPLAFAAYNAGPHRVDEWLTKYGDPRHREVDPVNWVEGIPYSETRNYVMRVMESLAVYRARLSGQTPPLRLSMDLRKK